MTFLEKMMERSGVTKVPRYAKESFGYRARVSASGEFHRIDSLPRRTWDPEQLAQAFEMLHEELKTSSGEMALRQIQVKALHDCVLYRGGFFPIGVGQGKALISLLAPVAMEAQRPMLVVPAQLREQTDRLVIPRMRKHWHLHPRLLVLGYSELSLAKNADLLEEYSPDLVILDECFVAGTLIQTERGDMPIEDIQIGDRILSFDEKSRTVVYKRVVRKFEKYTKDIVDLMVSDERISCTANHPFLTTNGWRKAGELKLYDRIVRAIGTPFGLKLKTRTNAVRVQQVEHRNIENWYPMVKVYNLEVETTGTYILDSGIVVHNCHRLKNKKAGRTRRVLRYFKEHPETRCVAMSGTVSNRSIRDYAHIIEWCLKGMTPVPLRWHELTEWADCVDEKVPDEKRVHPGALEKWIRDGENARQGFRRRLVETPGVVASEEGALGTSLLISQFEGLKIPPNILGEINRMRNTWETPNEDIITEAVELWRHIRELALGFFYRWDPPAPRDWMDKRKEWKRFVRETLKTSKDADTELQVWNLCRANREPVWMAWAAIKDTFKPNSVPVWLDDFALRACSEWMERIVSESSQGIVWTEHRAFGERLKDYGFEYYGAGNNNILYTNSSVIAASIAAHGEGKNLERYSRNLVVSPPTSGKVWEQCLGRTHRPGQEADEVTCEVFLDVSECRESFEQARRDAKYLEDSLGNIQKLNYADITIKDR